MVLVVSTGSLPIPLILPQRMAKCLTVEKKLGVSHAFQLYLITFFLYKSIISGTFFLPLSIRPYFLGVFGGWVWSTLTRCIHPTRLQKWSWPSLVQFIRWLHFFYKASLGLVPKREIQPVEGLISKQDGLYWPPERFGVPRNGGRGVWDVGLSVRVTSLVKHDFTIFEGFFSQNHWKSHPSIAKWVSYPITTL